MTVNRYALRRIVLIVPTVWGITLLAFAVAHLAPGDAAAEAFRRREGRLPSPPELVFERQELGLDRPLPEQYMSWVTNAAQGDFGASYSSRRPIYDELRRRIPLTLELTALAAVIAVLVGLLSGVLAAVHHNRLADQLLRIGSLGGSAVPSFWLALLLMELFAVRLSVLHVAGRGSASNLILPAVTLALAPAAGLARFTRATLLETLNEGYVTTALAKGLAGWAVVVKHGLRNCALPLVTAFGTSIGFLLAGAVVVETVFSWPGMGSFSVEAILERDYPAIQAAVLYAGLVFAVMNLLVDLSYALTDPRVRLGGATISRR